MIYLNILFIALICMIVTDELHFFDEVSSRIKSLMTGGKMSSPINNKLLTCSTCQSWWCSLLYIILTNNLSFWMVFYALLVASFIPVFDTIYKFIKGLIMKFFGWLGDKINI